MHVYFSGIGGVGIGPLAMLALDLGHKVSGSDLHKSDMTELLKNHGAKVHIGQDGSQVEQAQASGNIDWLIYTSALSDDHPELTFARKSDIKISKRHEFLNQILKDNDLKLVAVSGTHGKTTTTGMLVWLLQQLGLPVSYSIGTEISFGPPAQYQKGSKYFIYECDEFDRNFLYFQPEVSLITTLDYDHSDTYETMEDYVDAFNQFIRQSKLCITWQSIVQRLNPDSHIVSINEDNDMGGITLPGHNRQNAWLAATTIEQLGLLEDGKQDWQDLLKKVSSFPGTKRRFEKLADNLYTDYAHHPAEIASTIKMAREINSNIIIIYQPHQNIRQHEILKEGGYKDAFDGAKKVYWLPTYLSREYQELKTLAPDQLIKTLENPGLAEPAKLNKKLLYNIENHRANGNLILAMSAGNLDPWLRKNVASV